MIYAYLVPKARSFIALNFDENIYLNIMYFEDFKNKHWSYNKLLCEINNSTSLKSTLQLMLLLLFSDLYYFVLTLCKSFQTIAKYLMTV